MRDQSKVYIGMGGWELEPFNRLFYPPKPVKGFRKLEYYSQFFDSVEINATFYNTSFTPVHARHWLADVSGNKNFMFTVKLFQGFTHTLNATMDDVRAVQKLLDELASAGKLGGLLMQFPYSFTNLPERRHYLKQFGKVFEPHRVFVEMRHNSWNHPVLYNFFKEHKLHLVNVDLPKIKQHIPLNTYAWNGVSYFRMMGRNASAWTKPWRLEADGKHAVSDRYNYLYSEKELEFLLYYIEKAKEKGNTVYVVFHNDPEANSLINGFQLRHLAENKQRVAVPRNFVSRFPALEPISTEAIAHHPLFEAA